MRAVAGRPLRRHEQQLRFLSHSARLEESAAPYAVRRTMLELSALVFLFIGWSLVAQIEEIAQAPGEVVPNGFTRIVQHYDGGIVKEIMVQEGSEVKAGAVLLKLDGAGAEEELNKALIAREGLKHAAATASELFSMQDKLRKQKIGLEMRYLQARQARELAESELAQQTEVIARLEERVKRLHIVAPITGLVKGMKINTIGAVIKPGDPLMEIVPTGETLVVEARISPSDIGHVAIGQKVKVKVSSFDYGRFGAIDGTLEFITATTFENHDGSKYYRGRIRLQQDHVGTHKEMKVQPGMTVQAGIITGRKSVFAYMLKPVQRAIEDGLSEK